MASDDTMNSLMLSVARNAVRCIFHRLVSPSRSPVRMPTPDGSSAAVQQSVRDCAMDGDDGPTQAA